MSKFICRRLLFGVSMGLIALAAGCGTQTETPITQSAASQASADKVNRLLTFCERMHKSGDLAVAAGLCQRAYHLAPEDPRALVALGAIMLELGKPQDAVLAYRTALTLDHRSIEALIGLGKAHLALKQFDEAERQFQLAIRTKETDYRGFNGLGVLHDLRGEHVVAQSFYQTGLRLAPGNASLRSNLGLSLSLTGHHRQAIAILGDLTNDYQSDATNRQNLALAYGRAGDMPTAERVARMDLGDAAVAKNLKYYSAFQAKPRPEPAPPAVTRPKKTGAVPTLKTPSKPVAARPAAPRKAKTVVVAKRPIKRHVPDPSVIASGTAPGAGLPGQTVVLAAKRSLDRGVSDDSAIVSGTAPGGGLPSDAVLAASTAKSLSLPPVDLHPDPMTPDQSVVAHASYPNKTPAVASAARLADDTVADASAIASGTAPGGNPSSDAVLAASIAKSLGLPPVDAHPDAMTIDQSTASGAESPPADLDVPALSQTDQMAASVKSGQATGRYRLHLGSFRRHATAEVERSRQRKLIADLIEGGMELVVSEADLGVEKGHWYRVTLQGVDDRSRASALCSTLHGRGLSCFVTVAAKAARPQPASVSQRIDTAPQAPAYAVQLGAYRQESNLRTEWQRFQHHVPTLLADQRMMIRHSWAGGRPLYMLNTEGQSDKEAARQLCQELQSAGLDCVVAKVI